MGKNTCPQCQSNVLPTDLFCPVCGASIGTSEQKTQQDETTDVCWFCKKYPAENGWGVPVQLAANPKEYGIDQNQNEFPAVPGTQLMGEKRTLKYDVKTISVPRCSHCGTFLNWNKRWANGAAVVAVALPLVLGWISSFALPEISSYVCFISPILSFTGAFGIYFQLAKRKRLALGIPEKINIQPALAKKHPQVLALIEQGWQIGLPKGYKPKVM